MRDLSMARKAFLRKLKQLGLIRFSLKLFEVCVLGLTSRVTFTINNNRYDFDGLHDLLNRIDLKKQEQRSVYSVNMVFGNEYDFADRAPLSTRLESLASILNCYDYNKMSSWAVGKFGLVWNYDPVSNYYFETKMIPYNKADIKIPWELGRFSCYPSLVQKHSNVEEIADKFVCDVVSFYSMNSRTDTIQWCNAMEAGLRISNLTISYLFFLKRGVSFPRWFDQIFRSGLKLHEKFILANLEFSFVQYSNHYTANLLGLCSIYTITNNPIKFYIVKKLIEKNIKRSVHKGFLDEGSTAYHRFTTEMFVACSMFAKIKNNCLRSSSIEVIEGMIEFCMLVQRPDHLLPLIGDSDGGFVNYFEVGYSEKYGTHTPYYIPDFVSFGRYAGVCPKESSKFKKIGYINDNYFYLLKNENTYLLINLVPNPKNYINKTHFHDDYGNFELFLHNRPVKVDQGSPYYTLDFNAYSEARSQKLHLGIHDTESNECDFFSNISRPTNVRLTVSDTCGCTFIELSNYDKTILKLLVQNNFSSLVHMHARADTVYAINYNKVIDIEDYYSI